MKRFLKRRGIFILAFMMLSVTFVFNNAMASVVLKIIATNPSENNARRVPIKVYLPKEAKPEDVIDKRDLQVGYDSQQGSYYVYGSYELEPLQVVERDIELRDVWIIEEAELTSIAAEAEKIKELLKDSEFTQRSDFLTNSIISKINEIENRQAGSSTNPEEHISEYRYNLELLKSAKTDLAVARSMLGKERRFPKEAIWKLIIYVVAFLGILSTSFYFVWHKQVNALTGKKEFSGSQKNEFKQNEDTEEETSSAEEDIEKMLGGE
jgi:hypothetical protein